MKLKNKLIVLLLAVFAILIIAPSMVNAATLTWNDTEQGIEWQYEVDSSGNVINLKCNTTSKIGAVTIPSQIDGKTVISLKGYFNNGAFQNCAGITSVTIPNTITLIGEYAFENCTGLKSITIPDSVTKIGAHAFYGCAGMKSITLSNNLTSIGIYAFGGCTGLKSLTMPNSVTTLGESAFADCSGLRELTLSENLTRLTDKAFLRCTGLTSVVLPESVTTIEGEWSNIYGAFGECTNLGKILIPDSVASIGIGAFQGCNKLTIYGNDGMTSKEYAEENGINFKLISEWNEAETGDDVTPPKIKDFYIDYSADWEYDSATSYYMVNAGADISIQITFDEKVYGEKAPTLTIKCGNGKEIVLSNGVITGEHIVYTYKITKNDVGIISAVSIEGGDIKDEAGNAVEEYVCPELKSGIMRHYVYANGTVSNPEDGTNDGSNTGTTDGTNNGSTGGSNNGTTGGSNNPDKGTGKDNTTAKGELPKTGKMTLISILVVIVVAGITSFVKTKKYKGI